MKILYGICGIGNGHLFRQLPILTTLLKQGAKVVVFAYDSSYNYLKSHLNVFPNMHLIKVAVPYYVGNESGLDFEQSLLKKQNEVDFFSINCQAMAQAEKLIGKPDLAISDYEPITAQYAYAWNCPLVTIDQQSKYLTGIFPRSIEGCFYADEVMRLRMFFPKASMRLACSFFSVESDGEVVIVPPILRDHVYNLKRQPQKGQILVYFSSQQFQKQPLKEFLELFAKFPDYQFHVFTPEMLKERPSNVYLYIHGDPKFDLLLESCSAIISTAGHSLLSEAMALEIPVLALPLPIYEQQMNGWVIGQNKFGLCSQELSFEILDEFLNKMVIYSDNISRDKSVRLQGNGVQHIFKHLGQAIPSFSAPAVL